MPTGRYPRLHHLGVHRAFPSRRLLYTSSLLILDPLVIIQCQIDTERNHVYFYPLQVSEMKPEWPESGRSREWVSVEEAIARVCTSPSSWVDRHRPPADALYSFATLVDWRPEQAEALQHFSTWRDTLVESDTSNESSESGLPTSGADEWCVPPRSGCRRCKS